ncbi:MAG: FKBP-type peptidyl-prolyl cis-trans isomerase [Phycisphaeraceae bacterium]|nr:FKBP-type peptidyl-prolyl cis-trans isomerase [Phycisphaeraceae bacterium]
MFLNRCIVLPIILVYGAMSVAIGSPAQPEISMQIQPQPPAAIPVPNLPIVSTKTLESGIIIEEMKIGDGYEVQPGGVVVAHYHGTLKDGGAEFDSSFKRGEPIAFPLAGVIAGWQEGVPGMKVGGIRRLTIPSAKGYGERGVGTTIPPNADLVFVIQLVDAMQIEDVVVGQGEEATPNCVAVTAHVIKNSQGEEIERCDASKPYIWLPGEFQPITFGLEGMKQGGKRRLVVPKEMNVSPPQLADTRPQNVPITIEVELISVRNLGQHTRR